MFLAGGGGENEQNKAKNPSKAKNAIQTLKIDLCSIYHKYVL